MDENSPGTSTESHEVDPWREYLRWAGTFVEWEEWDEWERNYKLEIGDRLVAARTALLQGDSNWAEQVRLALNNNNLIPWRAGGDIRNLCKSHPDDVQTALQMVWDGERSVRDRLNDFAEAIKARGLKGHIAEVSGLHMAMEPTKYPVFRADPVTKSYKLTGYSDDYSDLGTRYEHYLAFLDEMMERAEAAGFKLRDRLDAQSVMWSIKRHPLPNATDEEQAAFDRYRNDSRQRDGIRRQ